MREHGGDSEAARALDVHEERVRALNQTLELVAAGLMLRRGVGEVDGESLVSVAYSPLWMSVKDARSKIHVRECAARQGKLYSITCM